MKDPNRNLIEALAERENHRFLYLNNATFKMSVDVLARMLPFWLDGLAEHANQNQADFETRLHRLTKGIPT